MAKKLPHISKHRVGKKIVEIPRHFDQIHIDAGYHTQQHGEHSTPQHELHGTYFSESHGTIVVSNVEGEPEYGLRCPCGAVGEPDDDFKQHLREDHQLTPEQMTFFLERGPHRVLIRGSITVGPEFKLEWDNSMALTVLCADAVRQYLKDLSATKRKQEAT